MVKALSTASLVLVVLLTSCGGETNPDNSPPALQATEPPSTTLATSSPSGRSYGPRMSPPALPVGKEDQRRVVESYFKSLETVCKEFTARSENPPIESTLFSEAKVVEEKTAGKWLLIDGGGTQLIVDTTGWKDESPGDAIAKGGVRPAEGAWIVTGLGGPRDLTPRPYLFGCPEDVFVGTIDH